MFDPSTVAFEIKYPWKKKNGYRDVFIIVWHEDPCTDGSDNSCDWFGSKRKLNPQEKALQSAISNLETILDNRPFYPDHPAHIRFRDVHNALWDWRKRPKLRWHPRWHFHHWRIQIRPLQQFKRWAFEKCCICKCGFRWNESVMGNWDGDRIWHHRCDKIKYSPTINDEDAG